MIRSHTSLRIPKVIDVDFACKAIDMIKLTEQKKKTYIEFYHGKPLLVNTEQTKKRDVHVTEKNRKNKREKKY